MLDELVAAIVNRADLIVVALIVVVVYAFVQAVVNIVRDWFLVKVFKKKLNGSGRGNGKRDVQLDELIQLSTERNETLKCLPTMASQVGEMHEATMAKDDDGVTRIGNAFKRVHLLYKKLGRG